MEPQLRRYLFANTDAEIASATNALVAGHNEFFRQHIRTSHSAAFNAQRPPTKVIGDPWILQMRRAKVIEKQALTKTLGKAIRKLDSGEWTDGDISLIRRHVETAIAQEIDLDWLVAAWRAHITNTDGFAAPDLEIAIDALNAVYTVDGRIGQPVFVGFVDVFLDVFEQPNADDQPRIKTTVDTATIGTTIRDRLGIQVYGKGEPMLLFSYRLSNALAPTAVCGRGVQPTVLDIDAGNPWFVPSSSRYGPCGHTVDIRGDPQPAPCCELIHPQREVTIEECIWAGSILESPPDTPVPFRHRHRTILRRGKCAGRCLEFEI